MKSYMDNSIILLLGTALCRIFFSFFFFFLKKEDFIRPHSWKIKSLESEFDWFLCHARSWTERANCLVFCTQIITLCKWWHCILHTDHYSLQTIELHFAHKSLHFANNCIAFFTQWQFSTWHFVNDYIAFCKQLVTLHQTITLYFANNLLLYILHICQFDSDHVWLTGR